MAEPLKLAYGPSVPEQIAEQLCAAFPAFDKNAFLQTALSGYESLELMARARQISRALKIHLPADFETALRILISSIGAPLDNQHSFGMAPFHYLPHVFFVGDYGSAEIQLLPQCMEAQYQLTQRFTAEFSMRPFLINFPNETLEFLHRWSSDPNEHVRRLVSEGSRPRLPWAPRIRAFQRDPSPTLALLEKLKDDPSRYVQRSVANHLNDISKDNLDIFYNTLERWQNETQCCTSQPRQWIIKHALRNAIKRGDSQALSLSGLNPDVLPTLIEANISPSTVGMGETTNIACQLKNQHPTTLTLQIDLVVDYVKANQSLSRKVFKWKRVTMAPNTAIHINKNLSLRELTTRKHYSGQHPVGLQINGRYFPLGHFELNATS
jgi:3-methyladenine DNA glycosylase AlkC